MHEYVGRDQTCGLQKLQVAPLTVPLFLEGRIQEPFGFNLDSGTTCRLSQPTDLTGTDPLLAKLASNGGPTQTQALQPGSPAIDRGGTSANGCPPTDQRGVPRPRGPACDIRSIRTRPMKACLHTPKWRRILICEEEAAAASGPPRPPTANAWPRQPYQRGCTG